MREWGWTQPILVDEANLVLAGHGQIIKFPDGLVETRLVLTDARRPRRIELANKYGIKIGGGASLKPFLDFGCKPIPRFQLRYVYFLNHQAQSRLTVPALPFSKIEELGAGMYKGIAREKQAMSGSTGTAAV